MKLATWHFHIEISSKCTLRCPRCAREEVPETLVNTELRLDFFKKNFTSEFIRDNIEKITLCGDDGDPIYAHDLIDVVTYFKSIKPSIQIVITTNGSYKKTDWWTKLSKQLLRHDLIHFSLDGWDQESNEKYRINSDWKSIINGVHTLRANSEVQMVWAAIPFSFNEHHLDNMKQMAKELGFDHFQTTFSTKFNSVWPGQYPIGDSLQPTQEKMYSSTKRFQRKLDNLSGRDLIDPWMPTNIVHFQKQMPINDTNPLCGIGNKGLFINSQGQFFPCCWIANRYTHNQDWSLINNPQFNLHNKSLEEVLSDPFWSDRFENFSWNECKDKCNISMVDYNYATEY